LTDTVALSAGDATLRLRERGAEPVSWTVAGRELLWPGGDAWARSSPVLFPIVGWARNGQVRVGCATYPMGVHGFASGETFSASEDGGAGVTFTLRDNQSTRSHYPFAFRLEVSYRLAPRDVSIGFEVANTGDVAMPFAIGLHPGFAWPFTAADEAGHAILFEREEETSVPAIDGNGLFTDASRPIAFDGRRLPLSSELLSREALCFLHAKSRSVRFVSPSGEAIAVEMENFPHIALWSRPPAPFLCVECWTGHGDPQGFEGDLAEKPSMRILAPGGVSRHAIRWRFEERAT